MDEVCKNIKNAVFFELRQVGANFGIIQIIRL